MAVSRLLLKLCAVAGFLATASATYDVPTTTEPCPTMPPTKYDSSTCKTLQDKDRPGYDFKNVTAAVTSCGDLCKADNVCKTWAWSKHAGGTCWLKNFVGPLVDLAGVVATECTYHENVPEPAPTSAPTPGPVPVYTPTSTPGPYQPSCSLQNDMDLTGEDIGNKPAKSASLCCDICKTFDKCKAWSWNSYNGGTCWLKKNVGQKIAKAGVVSSWPAGSAAQDNCAFEFNTDFEGNDIGNTPAKDAGECCSICKANKSCKAYTWTDYQSGTCWMKSAKGKTVAKAGAVSAKLA